MDGDALGDSWQTYRSRESTSNVSSMSIASLHLPQILIDEGADFDKVTESGHTPLHTAAGFGLLNIVKVHLGRLLSSPHRIIYPGPAGCRSFEDGDRCRWIDASGCRVRRTPYYLLRRDTDFHQETSVSITACLLR